MTDIHNSLCVCITYAFSDLHNSLCIFTDIDLKDASKAFSKKFSCGSSIQGEDEIEIQGDVKDDLFDFLPEKWSQVIDILIDVYCQKFFIYLYEL